MNPDELALLEEERRFLLRSIDDLDREYAAGDVDDADYTAVRDGYVARAAAVLRQIEDGTAALPEAPRKRWGRIAAWSVGVMAIAALSAWLVVINSGQRVTGQTMTGGQAVDEVSAKLAQARSLLGTDPGGAITLYQEVIAVEPGNPVFTDPNATIAWSGNLQPEMKTDVSLKTFLGRGSGESVQMKFDGHGFVVVQPFEELPLQATATTAG